MADSKSSCTESYTKPRCLILYIARPLLAQIVDWLDVKDIVYLARSCKEMFRMVEKTPRVGGKFANFMVGKSCFLCNSLDRILFHTHAQREVCHFHITSCSYCSRRTTDYTAKWHGNLISCESHYCREEVERMFQAQKLNSRTSKKRR